MSVARALRPRVFNRDGHRCRRCGQREPLSLHHLVPRSHGGADSLENLITLCVACHEAWHTLADVLPDWPFNEWLTTESRAADLALLKRLYILRRQGASYRAAACELGTSATTLRRRVLRYFPELTLLPVASCLGWPVFLEPETGGYLAWSRSRLVGRVRPHGNGWRARALDGSGKRVKELADLQGFFKNVTWKTCWALRIPGDAPGQVSFVAPPPSARVGDLVVIETAERGWLGRLELWPTGDYVYRRLSSLAPVSGHLSEGWRAVLPTELLGRLS